MKIIKLSQGKETIICDCHYDLIKDMKWTYFTNAKKSYHYGYRKQHIKMENGKQIAKTIMLHRVIMQANNGEEIDHIDGNGLNNQCSNLRFVTSSQNHMNHPLQSNNTSGYPGVTWDTINNKWRVTIKIDGKSKWIGRYVIYEDAVYARKKAEETFFGGYSRR